MSDLLIKNWSKADWKELLKWAKIGANNAMIGEFTEVEELPPHGRLIDEKDICDKIRPLIENPYCYNRLQIISETLGNCLQIVRDTPTIIPAEEGE